MNMNVKIKEDRLRKNGRIALIATLLAGILVMIGIMLTTRQLAFDNGRFDMSERILNPSETVELTGLWEFYHNRLLLPKDFAGESPPKMDSLIKVPGSWADHERGKVYSGKGVATYRLVIDLPQGLKDPGLKIKTISTAYRLYVNGRLSAEVGKVSNQPDMQEEGAKVLIIPLPTDQKSVELIFQVANLHYAKGGLRESPSVGSMKQLEVNRTNQLALQLLFIGGVVLFGVYYLLLFALQSKNRTALFFSGLCLITGLRSMIWGEIPIRILFPEFSFESLAFINYLTGYNVIPLMLLFIVSIYSLDYKKISLGLVLLPTLVFDGLLLTSTQFMSNFTGYLYLTILIQLGYILYVMIRAILNNRSNAILMYGAVCVYVLTVNQDILHFTGIGGLRTNNMFLYGNFVVIVAMSYIQAKEQSDTSKKLVLLNEKLIEADRLKDKIVSTEMAFLQAQIKPHFLYNALSAIANVCEKDGSMASRLILDLAMYLRGSFAFNNLEELVTLEKELEFVNTYFHIEQARFGDKIALHFSMDCEASFKIPVLVLQPLVENAVRHGISKKSVGGSVWVGIKSIAEGLSIEIRDDGIGMDQHRLDALLTEGGAEKGVGLLNIDYRLRKMYGLGLEISSEAGKGTCVRFVILKEGGL